MEKFAGLGMKNLIVVAMFVMIFIVMMKTITVKYPIPGVTDIVAAV